MRSASELAAATIESCWMRVRLAEGICIVRALISGTVSRTLPYCASCASTESVMGVLRTTLMPMVFCAKAAGASIARTSRTVRILRLK